MPLFTSWHENPVRELIIHPMRVQALTTLLSRRIKIMLLAGNLTYLTAFYVSGAIAGRRSGRTRTATYRMPWYSAMLVLGVVIVIGEVAAQWVDRDSGRPALLIWPGIFILGYLYYGVVLMRRPAGWRQQDPRDIDAEALAARRHDFHGIT